MAVAVLQVVNEHSSLNTAGAAAIDAEVPIARIEELIGNADHRPLAEALLFELVQPVLAFNRPPRLAKATTAEERLDLICRKAEGLFDFRELNLTDAKAIEELFLFELAIVSGVAELLAQTHL